jgi:flagellar biosynthesis/type III secretory pathway protein FliH
MEQTDAIFEKKNTMGVIEQWAEIKHQEGIEKGLEKGRKEERKEFVRSLLANTEFSPEKIAKLVGVPVAIVEKIKKSLSAK